MKKLSAIAMSLTFMLTVFSCGERKITETNQSAQENVQLLQYKSADLRISDDFSDIYSFNCNKSEVYIFGELKNGGICGYTTDFNYTDYSEFRFVPSENEEVLTGAINRVGKKLVLTEEDGTSMLYIYSREDEPESKNELGELSCGYTKPTIVCGSDYYYINCSDAVYVTTAKGELKGKVNTGGKTVFGVSADSDGNIVILMYDMKNGLSLGIADGTEITETQAMENGINSTPYSLCSGNNDYRLYAVYDTGLYGLKGNKWEQLSDLMDTGFNCYTFYKMIPTGEKDIAVLRWDNVPSMHIISEMDISEIKPRQVVTVASLSSGIPLHDNEIKKFNKNSEDYRVQLIDYTENGDYSKGAEKLRMDMITGNAPDIILLNDENPVDTFANNSTLFCDLYEFMENDEDISKEDILPNIREGLERKGKMVMVSPNFFFQTVPANPEIKGVKENWSLDDFYESYRNKNDRMTLFRFEDTELRWGFFYQAIKPHFFIDYEKAECNFNTPDYINAIKFFNDNEIGLTTTAYDTLLGDMYYDISQNDLLDGKIYCNFENHDAWFGSIFENVRLNKCILAGSPNNNGECGSYIMLGVSYAIMANAKNKEGAWSFLKSMLTDEYYNVPESYYCFPIIEKYFDEHAKTTMDKFPTFDYDKKTGKMSDEIVYMDWDYRTYNDRGEVVSRILLEPFTQEEYEHYSDLVKSAKVVRSDGEIERICNMELAKCFDGELSAEETAEHIQERVALYLSEKYG